MFDNFQKNELSIFRIQQTHYAAVLKESNNCAELLRERIVQEQLNCHLNPKVLQRMQRNYADIIHSRCFSFEDFYLSFGLQNQEKLPPIFSKEKSNYIATYKEKIIKIVQETLKQIHLNINNHKIEISQIAHVIFYTLQPFDQKNPRFRAKLWLINSNCKSGLTIRKAFEKYTYSAIQDKLDRQFCVECLTDLMNGIISNIDETCRVHYLDGILDYFHNWYFDKAQKINDFHIFPPDCFDEVKEFLLGLYDNNPYVALIDHNYRLLSNASTLLDAKNIITIEPADYNKMTMTNLRRLYRKYSDLVIYINKCSIFDCTVYDLSVIKDLKISQITREVVIQKADIIFNFENIISEPEEFIKNTVKLNLRSLQRDKSIQLSA